MLGMRFASMVFPEPGGLIMSMLWTLSGKVVTRQLRLR